MTPDLSNFSPDELRRALLDAASREAHEAYLARRCFVCNEPDVENGGSQGYLTSIEVVIARGQEDHSEVIRWLCEHHLTIAAKVLVEVGVGSHYHTGFNHLELDKCDGHLWPDDCPEPEDKFGEREKR